MLEAAIIEELKAFRAHSLLAAEWAGQLITKIENPAPLSKARQYQEQRKLMAETQRMKTILKKKASADNTG